jgi:hypothetical protein
VSPGNLSVVSPNLIGVAQVGQENNNKAAVITIHLIIIDFFMGASLTFQISKYAKRMPKFISA